VCIYASCKQAKKHLMNRKLISSGSKFEKEIGYSRAVIDSNWIFVSGTTWYNYGFVGYGIRLGSKYVSIYNMNGNKGLVIELSNG